MDWISAAELLLTHERVINVTGGLPGIANPAGLASALVRPFTTFGGEEAFPDLPSKVAALIHSIIAFHPFRDGNKRTALEAADMCLRYNGFRIVPSDEVDRFFWAIARGEKSIDDIAQWLRPNTEPWHYGHAEH